MKPKVVTRVTIPRSGTPRVDVGAWAAQSGRPFCRVFSWNVAGLRGLLNRPASADALRAFVQAERPDVLCLQVGIMNIGICQAIKHAQASWESE
jgi:hypothetical protein